jgi:hypothetical protein
MTNRGAWEDNRYKVKKIQALGLDGRMRHYRWLGNGRKREIMPDCILQCVRNWLPKTDDEEYVGHRWQNQ